ncbi:transposase [uncultured Roseivirga sp.]|uniref:REP-associated tyrosine transposase n=1 Tax=uncultured Roseivirga sp. TaxID=543088 RepID=UPI0030DA5639|tara:strand:+ start:47564 stop:48115 length:552 start_codon:yes stop_codon:yes gene_type:complete
MGRKYAIRSQEQFYFVTFTVVYWLDVFIRQEYRNILIDSIKYCQKEKGLLVGAWCIMTSHVHLILGTDETSKLEDIIRDLKSYTSRHIRKYMENNPQESRKEWMLWMMKRAGEKKSNNKDFQFWQQHNHPIELSTKEIMLQRLDYIHNNPVDAGFVDQPADWVFSSARDYEDQKGIIEISFLY